MVKQRINPVTQIGLCFDAPAATTFGGAAPAPRRPLKQ